MKLSNNTIDLMKEITQVVGISGSEKNISTVLQQYYKKYTDEIVFDNLGSVFAVKRSKKENAKKVMICAHMDEIGFIINEIKDNGLLKVLPLGDRIEKDITSKRVRITTNSGEVRGVIVTGDTKNKDNILVDIGASNKKEVLELGVTLGNSVVIDGEFEVLPTGKRIVSKAFDDRYGCVLGIEILESLKDIELDVDLYVGCTVQNEVGLRGCITATNLIKPDISIVLDCLKADDLKGNEDAVGKLGHGVLISYYDKSMMPNRALLNYLVDVCETNDIKHQYYYSMDDSDGGWIHKLQIGCPTLKACICARNLKSNSEIIDVDDYISAKEATIAVIKGLNEEKIEYFKRENR
ncbi:M42 family peptidase [Clostridium baratii]